MVHRCQLTQALSVAHVFVSMYCSVWFVDLVTSSLQNDLFWPGFAPSATQTYLLDVYRRHLTTTAASDAVPLNLLDACQGIVKAYGTPTTVGSVQSTYARSLALSAYTSVEDAVVGFRSLHPSYAFTLMTLYCWADFDRRWALAHTAARQARCATFMQSNGAVYLESVLRNVAWAPWAAQYGASFDAAVSDGIRATAGGEAWLASLENAFTSIDDEVAYWRSKHIARYELQWSNIDVFGIHESIGVVNMLGLTQALTTISISYAPRSSMWTSFALNWAFFDDLWAAAVTNSSLLRGASNYIGDATIESLLFVYPYTPASIALHNELGPFQSVDLFLVPPPTALVDAVMYFEASVARVLQASPSLLDVYKAVPMPLLDPVPVAWPTSTTTLRFLGGSPLCAYGLGTPFVQPSFSFDDTCGAEVPSRLALTVPPTVFAAAIAVINDDDESAFCRSCSVATTVLCTEAVRAAKNVGRAVLTATAATTDFFARFEAATDALASLDVEIVQFAIDTNGTTSVWRNAVLEKDWSFFGWVMLHEWALGLREVVSFQGDVRSFTLLSERVEPLPFAASALEVPTPTATYLYYVVVASTSWLLLVALLTLLYFVSSDQQNNGLALWHLFRVAGPVWLGRPILLLRAAAAITVLSTARVLFELEPLGRFAFAPRDLGAIVVLAGEAAWGAIVVSDVLLVLPSAPIWSGPLSTGLVWTTLVLLEVLSPIQMTATLHRECSRVNVYAQLSCTGGSVVIGSADRAWLLVAITVSTVVFCNVVARVVGGCRRRAAPLSPVDAAWPLAAAAVLLAPVGDIWSIDAATACTSGLVRLRLGAINVVFDIKLWVVFVAPSMMGPALPVVTPPCVETPRLSPTIVKRGSILRSKLMVTLGLFYVVGTASSSLSYLQLSYVNLANDFWWATFNTTGTQTFIANWFNRNVQVTPVLSSTRLDAMAFADMTSYASNSKPRVVFSPLYAHRVQYETGETLPLVIQGLRSMDGCDAPWIATAYCWLDLEKRVEMAVTSARQARCASKQSKNAAVYLEALLRNVQWDQFLACWGPSFERGIAFDAVSLLPNGQRWLASLPRNARSVQSEVDLWTKGHNLSFYLPQWQNYKDLGLTDVFSVENAFGIRYDLTLQSTRATYRLAAATSRKMYWSFASDLDAVNANSSGLAGLSLLRSSPRFAFQNRSATAVYTRNGSVLQAPLSASYVVFESHIGPFGSVDLYHVAPPQSLLTLQRDINEALAMALTSSTTSADFPAQASYKALILLNSLSPVPLALDRTIYRCSGGNLFCNDLAFDFNFSNGMSQFTGVHATCNTAFNEWIFVSSAQAIFAVLSAGLRADTIPIACAPEVIAPADCRASLRSVHAFTSTYLVSTFRDRARTVERDVLLLGVGIMQYAQHVPTHALTMFFEPLFASRDMHYMSWALAYDWAVGIREALVVTGDVASLTILTAQSKPATFSASATELPVNAANYVRGFCQYISVVLVVVAIVVGFYAVSTMGAVEGWNLLEINRVGGMVWIGRPLLLVRSISALCILSTATLELVSRGDATVLATARSTVAAPMVFLTRVLAASELGWLVYIYNDITMVMTRQYTASYTIKAAVLCMLLAILLSVLAPIVHSVTIDRVCVFVTMDLSMQCHSGVVTIGSVTRLVTLAVIAIGVSTTMFVLDRARFRLPPPREKDSYLLSSGARYLFEKERWVVHGIYYLDYASAALSGLLVLPYEKTRYIFDIKTWRVLVLTDDEVARVILNGKNVSHPFPHALPLIK